MKAEDTLKANTMEFSNVPGRYFVSVADAKQYANEVAAEQLEQVVAWWKANPLMPTEMQSELLTRAADLRKG
jgi:hypothetical protein